MSSRPLLSVVIPAREGLSEAAPALEALGPEMDAERIEVIVVGDSGGAKAPSECVRLISTPVGDMLSLRLSGMAEARGEVVAVGEDHAVPGPGWCEAVIRAHAENPDAPAIAGCLVNATDATVAGRANFLAFAAAWQPPMATLPQGRPPPASTLSFKRDALSGIASQSPGWLEAELIPALFDQGLIVADERVLANHFQDHGTIWSIRNAFDSARGSYGYQGPMLSPARRREVARWAIAHIPRQIRAEARAASSERIGAPDSAVIATIGLAAALGAAIGTFFGPGRSRERVA